MALFTNPQKSSKHKFQYKFGSHSTIHKFKNYFAIVFSVFSFQFSANKLYPNTPFMWTLDGCLFLVRITHTKSPSGNVTLLLCMSVLALCLALAASILFLTSLWTCCMCSTMSKALGRALAGRGKGITSITLYGLAPYTMSNGDV